jgi:hypothetical protein
MAAPALRSPLIALAPKVLIAPLVALLEITAVRACTQSNSTVDRSHVADHDGIRTESNGTSDYPSHSSFIVSDCGTADVNEFHLGKGADVEGTVDLEGPRRAWTRAVEDKVSNQADSRVQFPDSRSKRLLSAAAVQLSIGREAATCEAAACERN